ncbi:nucleoid-associated protein [Pantoea agglomerans]|uniref:nucleoid-associated protein n=1 Tax=Enterobacter agglomerans TaxID=549 RepID=UPI00301BE1B0
MTEHTAGNTILRHFVVHIMNKEQRGNASLLPSPEEKNVQAASQRLADDLTEKYSGRASKGYGKFEDNLDNFPMKGIVNDYFVTKEVDFYSTSIRMLEHLKARADEETMSTGGFVIIAHTETDDNQFLLVAILTSAIGATVHDFDIQTSEYLDIAKLRVAGRIDVTGWLSGKDHYISFLKGQNAVAAYFRKFLGCNDILLAKEETTKLKDALIDFANERNLQAEEREEFLNKSHERLKQLSKSSNQFDTQTFANELWPAEPELLVNKLASEDLEFSDGFVPDSNIIRALVSFKGRSQHWSLNFDRAALHDGTVYYDEENNRLILKDVPDTLKDEILSELGEDEDD